MDWDRAATRLRRRVRDEPRPPSAGAAAFAVVRLAAIGGLLVAAIVAPAAALGTYTVTRAADDVMSLPLTLPDSTNPQTSRVLAADGQLIAYFFEENRQDVPLDQIAPVMTDAILAIEDQRFYEHGALDFEGTVRALVTNSATGSTQGGSTITQQLVKMTLLQQAGTDEEKKAATEETIARKVRELRLAIDLEKEYSKDEILQQYLNIAYFGDGAYGIFSAASHYFSVTPDQLTAQQAAMLAGLVKNPVGFDPSIYPEKALQRRNTVLAVMGQQGKISEKESTDLQATDLGLNVTEYPNGCVTSSAAFSCDYVTQYLLQEPALGDTVEERREMLKRGGLTIKSNIDLNMQGALNAAVAEHVSPTDSAIGAMALVEPGTGKVRGVAQSRPMGRDKAAGQSYINFAVSKPYTESNGFQAGSTFKMFTLAAALDQGLPVSTGFNSPATMTIPPGTYFDCQDRGTNKFEVRNSTTSGYTNMYTGMRLSVNTYFAQLEAKVGLCPTVTMAREFGIVVPENQEVPSFTLGVTDTSVLDMAAAYATAASGGLYCKPQPVTEIVGSDGQPIKTYEPECTRVLTEEVAAQINDITRGLQEPGGFGYSRGTGLSVPSAAKTGTTTSAKAVWYVGYTPELAAAAMIAGADADGVPIALRGGNAAGSSVAGPMWADAMHVIDDFLSPVEFARPPQGRPSNPTPPAPPATPAAPPADPAAPPAP
ncbi:transglycosylase domain-containing protein [Aeromicrobium sp. Leaf350]|uniref:transglycosylase domain-containing protein n=1 Tax=Aeromicrobium sp. Leaf350 TaxID=2876565 RepID=UPI001E62295C|nr:transglycosylase domain-containing protein [Aeromicrobium sp. Leaf350]